MSSALRYFTKSRFNLAAECPTKLNYAGRAEYLDRSAEDSFLTALAEGGYQVGELACLMHPGGVRVDDLEHESALQQTATLLKQDNVTIFEAAVAVDRLFIRIDILKKVGNEIELIEVKSKSYSAMEDGDFRGKKGQLLTEFLPYLQDVAFQRYVAARALSAFQVKAFLMLADKDQYASVDGLNQRFKARMDGKRLRIDVAPGTDVNALGTPLLAKVAVDSQVDEILKGSLAVGPGAVLPFPDAVMQFAQAYVDDKKLVPMPTKKCGGCQFKADKWPIDGELKSGFHECWSNAFKWGPEDFAKGTVLDLWYFAKKSELIDRGVLKPTQVTIEDLNFDGQPPGLAGMSKKHRQWYVCKSDWPGGGEFFFDKQGFEEARKKWIFPLHCVDFETSTVAIPFMKGRRPYATTAFQFSHHVIDESGNVAHRTQWLCADPGVDPNFDFVRALKAALVNDKGTIFRWAAHENTVLNQIRAQLLSLTEPPPDRDELVAFIKSITSSGDGKSKVIGPRSMVDLCDLSEKFYFHPLTKGSTSLKKVLPALMNSSDFLRDQYGKPTYGGIGVSLNFEQPIAWWQIRDSVVIDPYSLLPPIFGDVSQQEIKAIEEGLSELQEGGAAMAAYGRLQFESLPADRRGAICAALLRYCELDTLAMVMAVQAWTAWTQK